jgi:plastocyanin
MPLENEVHTLTSSVTRRPPVLVAGLLALLLAACSSAASSTPPPGGQPPSDCAKVQGGVITLSAKNTKFSAPCLVASAGEAFTIHFTNEDTMPHNVAVYTDSSKGTTIMKGDIISSQGDSMDYKVDAQDAGQYYFDCQIHPTDMNGTLYVVSS